MNISFREELTCQAAGLSRLVMRSDDACRGRPEPRTVNELVVEGVLGLLGDILLESQ